MKLDFIILKDLYGIYKFDIRTTIPSQIRNSGFYSITRTSDEISVVCRQNLIIRNTIEISRDWNILKISGPLDLSMVGIIAEISGILKENEIPIFTISTHDTDYILVRNQDLTKAVKAFRTHGHAVQSE